MPNFEDHFQNKYTAIGKMEHRGPPIPDRDLEFALAALQQQRVRLEKGLGVVRSKQLKALARMTEIMAPPPSNDL